MVGDVNPDVIVAGMPQRLGFGQAEQLVGAIELVVGGSASITACGAARLGCDVSLAGVVGDDALGAWLLDRLRESGVDVDPVRTATGVATGASVVLDTGGDRAILTHLGAIELLSPDDLEHLGELPARHVHVASYYLLAPALRAALPAYLARWRRAGATTSVDTNWDPEERWDVGPLLEHVDVVLPNEAEAGALADQWAGYPGELVVKRGAHGATWQQAGHPGLSAAAPPGVAFVDATGAGDSFNAGFLAARLRGLDPALALIWAVTAGTLSTRGRGGTARQPTRDEVADLVGPMNEEPT